MYQIEIELTPIIHYNPIKLERFKQYLSSLNKHIIQSIITELKEHIIYLQQQINNTTTDNNNLYQQQLHNSKQSLLYINKSLNLVLVTFIDLENF